MASPPRGRGRLVLYRLPVTVAGLVLIGLIVAALTYVARDPGKPGFAATFVNNLPLTVLFASCADARCDNGGNLGVQKLRQGERSRVALRAGPLVNAFELTTQTSRRVGCFFLRFRRPPAVEPVIPLSRAKHC